MVLNRDAKHKLTSAESDAKYIAQGASKVPKRSSKWVAELAQMNHNKVGRPFDYPDSALATMAITKALMDDSYRKCQGYFEEIWGKEYTTSYSNMWKRVGNMMPVFERDPNFTLKEGTRRIASDSTGMKTANRGEWIRVHWNVKRGFFKFHILVDIDTRRILAFSLSDMNGGDAAHLAILLNDFLKMCMGEEIPIQESVLNLILKSAPAKASSRVDPHQTLMDRWTEEDKDASSENEESDKDTAGAEHKTEEDKDASSENIPEKIVMNEDELQQLESMLGTKLADIRKKLENLGIHIELRADGGYDAKQVFAMLDMLGIESIIRIRVNANAQDQGKGQARSVAALEQLGGRGGCTSTELNNMTKKEREANRKEWKKDTRYGLRWLVEIIISAFKRVFGESVRARNPHTAYIEIATKVAAYNCNLDIGDAAVRAMREQANTGPPPTEGIQLEVVAA